MKRGPKQPSFKATIWIATEYERGWRKAGDKLALQRIDALERQLAAQTKRGRDAKRQGFDVVAELHKAQGVIQAVPGVQVKRRGRTEERRARSDSHKDAFD